MSATNGAEIGIAMLFEFRRRIIFPLTVPIPSLLRQSRQMECEARGGLQVSAQALDDGQTRDVEIFAAFQVINQLLKLARLLLLRFERRGLPRIDGSLLCLAFAVHRLSLRADGFTLRDYQEDGADGFRRPPRIGARSMRCRYSSAKICERCRA